MSRRPAAATISPSFLARVLPRRFRRAWVVGGWVRDRLLGRYAADSDLVIEGNAEEAAAAAARRLAASFVVMGHGNFRVIVSGLHLDFAEPRAPTIEQDLLERDFTINAIALPFEHLLSPRWRQHLLDPAHGLRDLNLGLVRAVRPEAFDHDPLRMLRAIRFAAALDFKIHPAARRAIASRCHLISQAAGERVREEFFLILRSSRADHHLMTAARLGLLEALMPELTRLSGIEQGKFHVKDAFRHSLLTVRHINRLLQSRGSWPDEWNEKIQALLSRPIAGGRTCADMLRFAALTHDLGKAQTRTESSTGVHFYGHPAISAEMAVRIAQRLKLGRKEQAAVRILVENHMRPLLLARATPTQRSIRRLLLAAGEQTVPLALLAVADLLASGAPAPTRRSQQELTALLASAAFAQQAHGPPLVDGFKVMRRYNLQPGVEVGRLLKIAERAQMERGLRTEADAWRILDKAVRK